MEAVIVTLTVALVTVEESVTLVVLSETVSPEEGPYQESDSVIVPLKLLMRLIVTREEADLPCGRLRYEGFDVILKSGPITSTLRYTDCCRPPYVAVT